MLGGVLLLLCGRPAANLIMIVLLLCGSLYIFDITPAEVWVWLCAVTGGIHARGAAFAEQSAARRAERAAIRQAEREIDEEYDETEDEPPDEEDEPAGLHLGVPDWMSGALRWGHKVTQEMEADAADAESAPAAPAQPEPAPTAPPITPVRVSVAHPRAAFDVDLGPDHTALSEGGSEPIEPLIVGPGGTFGQDPLRSAPKPTPPPSWQTRWSPLRQISLPRTPRSRKSPPLPPLLIPPSSSRQRRWCSRRCRRSRRLRPSSPLCPG